MSRIIGRELGKAVFVEDKKGESELVRKAIEAAAGDHGTIVPPSMRVRNTKSQLQFLGLSACGLTATDLLERIDLAPFASSLLALSLASNRFQLLSSASSPKGGDHSPKQGLSAAAVTAAKKPTTSSTTTASTSTKPAYPKTQAIRKPDAVRDQLRAYLGDELLPDLPILKYFTLAHNLGLDLTKSDLSKFTHSGRRSFCILDVTGALTGLTEEQWDLPLSEIPRNELLQARHLLGLRDEFAGVLGRGRFSRLGIDNASAYLGSESSRDQWLPGNSGFWTPFLPAAEQYARLVRRIGAQAVVEESANAGIGSFETGGS